MKVKNWAKFLVMSILVLVIFLAINYGSSIWNAIKTFPLDKPISFILGAVTMLLANSDLKKKKDDDDE